MQEADAVSAREAKKWEQNAQRAAEAAARTLEKSLRKALQAEEPSAEHRALLAAHPEEAERLRTSIAKAEARKQQNMANAIETEEDDATLNLKIAQLAQMVRDASHTVLYTGAGLSTAAEIPDYRGPNGLWTLAQKGGGGGGGGGSSGGGGGGGSTSARNAPCAARQAMGMTFAEALPTVGHMAISGLVGHGHVQCVISQNVDGLHLRSGVPVSKLCEMHGNVFRERCPTCGKEYLRGFDVTGKSAYHRHGTERTCDKKACGGAQLRDTIVYFGEKVHPADLEAAREHSEACDLAIFIGSSLKVLTHYSFIWQALPKPRKKLIVIVNLQRTPRDKQADLRLFGRCDDVLGRLLAALKMSPPTYSPQKDSVHKLALKLPPPPPAPTPPQPPEPLMAAASTVANTAASTADDCEGGEEEGVEDETEEVEEEGGGTMGVDGLDMAPQKKRRRKGKALTYKRKAMPRAFPTGREHQPAAGVHADVTAAPPVPADEAEAVSRAVTSVPPPLVLEQAGRRSPMGLPPPTVMPRSTSSEMLCAASPVEQPPLSAGGRRRSGRNSPAATVAPAAPWAAAAAPPMPEAAAGEGGPSAAAPLSARRRNAASSAPEPASIVKREEGTAAAAPTPEAAPPAPPAAPAAPTKCAAKCGFFAATGSEFCSKCGAKTEAEWAQWHGVLSKKKRGR